ncbi:MAG: hypothetical protein FWF59_02365 [Turicibacter sp.]|nr:hypothetical protein [Turicibacter sp.]
MKELLIFYYQLPVTWLEALPHAYFTQIGDRFIYIIAVGTEKNTVFFHLLNHLQYNMNQRLILTKDNETTILFEGRHFYVIDSDRTLHNPVNVGNLHMPMVSPEPYPVAQRAKEKWLGKHQAHEEQLNIALEQMDNPKRTILFDLATYYIHLTEQAYTFVNELLDRNYNVSLCHSRLTPKTPEYELYSPEMLTLDNKSRAYCEYLRHLFLETENLDAIHEAMLIINHTNPLSTDEWSLLYARLYFPAHFYDALFDIRNDNLVEIDAVYDQALAYSRLLYQVPYILTAYQGATLRVPEWLREEVFAQ